VVIIDCLVGANSDEQFTAIFQAKNGAHIVDPCTALNLY